MKNLADRCPEWNEVGCLLHPNEKNNWAWLKALEIGEYLDLADEHCRNNAYPLAKRLGIKVSIRSLPNGDYRIMRVA